MSNLKLHKIETVKHWLDDLTQDSYGMNELKSYNGDELDKMTIKEIDMLLDFIKIAYHYGYQCANKNRRR